MSIHLQLLGVVCAQIVAQDGDTILDTALGSDIEFPHDCQAGNCGTCKCEWVSGEITELPYSEFALDPDERARNLILACRSQMWSDCVVRLLDADETIQHPSRVLRCRAEDIALLAPNVRRIRLRTDSGGPFTFSAGQYARIEFAPGIQCDLSMANRPDEAALEFHVQRVSAGAASEYVFDRLKAGEPVSVAGPLGHAYLRSNHDGPMLAIAAATGLAPIQSIVETALQADAARRIGIYHWVSAQTDAYAQQWLSRLARDFPNVSSACIVGVDNGERITEALAREVASFAGYKAYLAGTPSVVEALQRFLLESGVALRDIHAEPFFAGK